MEVRIRDNIKFTIICNYPTMYVHLWGCDLMHNHDDMKKIYIKTCMKNVSMSLIDTSKCVLNAIKNCFTTKLLYSQSDYRL